MRRTARFSRFAYALFTVIVVVVLFGLELRMQWGGHWVTKAVDDLVELAAAAAAGGCGIARGFGPGVAAGSRGC